MNREDILTLAEDWVAAWNDHDVDRVLSHFTEDATFSSPVAAQLLPETSGVLRGKPAIRAYWQLGLDKIPNLHFTIESVYTGMNTAVINYRNQADDLACEVLRFNTDGLVQEGAGTYRAGSQPGTK